MLSYLEWLLPTTMCFERKTIKTFCMMINNFGNLLGHHMMSKAKSGSWTKTTGLRNNVEHTQSLHYRQFFNDRSFLHHPHHSQCQSRRHHDGEAFRDSCHGQAEEKINDATLKKLKTALHIKSHASWEHPPLC